jgi:ABC-type polysaccharide/polyol phosphate transport system ATPase subunit
MLRPDRGEIRVLGKVSGLLELGAGFQPELTGRENLYLNARLFGLSQNQIDEKYEEIVNFANIGKFINAPVKCYSQGMVVRLAFAIAIHMDPDILLIDDTLAVGDEYFQRKCIKKIFQIKEQGKTIIFVTHDMNMLSRLCRRALFLKEGRIVKDDIVDKVIPLYTQIIGQEKG